MKAAPAPEDKWPQGMGRDGRDPLGAAVPPVPAVGPQSCAGTAGAVPGMEPGQGSGGSSVHPQPRSGDSESRSSPAPAAAAPGSFPPTGAGKALL